MTKKPVYKLLEGTAAINKAIDSIATRGKKQDRDIQVAVLSAMQHHATHGDVTLVNRLVEAMPKGSRVNALRAFIETFGACRYDAESKAFVHAKGKNHRLNEAHETMWSEFKPEKDYQSVDPVAVLKGAIKRLDADVKKLGDQSKVDPSLIAGLRDLLVRYQPEPMH